MIAIDLGRVGYADALGLQHRLVTERSDDRIDDVLLVCEHDPVYTAGRNADLRNVLDATRFPVLRADRGGDVTYHGPGQVVLYPIVRLTGPRWVRGYVEALQDACIDVASTYGVTAHTDRRRPGVWVGGDKLAAIGVRVQRGATSHGVAFNVDPDLTHYEGIVACGITDGSVCSLRSLGVDVDAPTVRDQLVMAVSRRLHRAVEWRMLADLGQRAT